MDRKIISLVTLLICLAISTEMFGQTPKSVYSMFGLGQMIDKNYGVNRALGGTGIAFQSGNTINILTLPHI